MGLLMRDLALPDLPACAVMVADSAIGERYGFTAQAMETTLARGMAGGGDLFVAEDSGAPAGFAWLEPRGAFSSAPYLRLIAVAPSSRGAGVGSALLAEFERRGAPIGRDFCLLVSDFNTGAIEFYRRHGYRRVGELPDFARPGIAEILMVKSRKDYEP